MKRIYDVAFATNNSGSHHEHLGHFWWIEGSQKGEWISREAAHDYLVANPGTVYVSEGGKTANVIPYHRINNPTIRWIQTDPDGALKDNLITLAKRHALGLVNR